jgi:hypothetical protein
MWMACHDRIQCGLLKKKQWSGTEECFSCGKLESSYHILFQCPIVVFLWSFMKDYLGWETSPFSWDSFFQGVVDRCRGVKQGLTLSLCAGAQWSIWKARNDVVFNKKTLSSPVVLIYKTIMLVKTWFLFCRKGRRMGPILGNVFLNAKR